MTTGKRILLQRAQRYAKRGKWVKGMRLLKRVYRAKAYA
mgnify:CR=1 FL=1